MKRRPRHSPPPRRRRRTVTCSTAWERDEVRLAAVGSCVRCLFPCASRCMTWGRRAAPGRGGLPDAPIPYGRPLAHLLGADGRDFGDASHMDGAAGVLSELQAAQRGVQQVPDHLVVDLGRGKELGASPRSVGTRWGHSVPH